MKPPPGKERQKPSIATSTLELIVTPEMREKIERKRQKRHLLGEELRGKECGEINLGDLDKHNVSYSLLSPTKRVPACCHRRTIQPHVPWP